MSSKTLALLALQTLALVATSGAAELLGPRHHCHDGNCNCPMIEEIVYQDVIRHRCKMVEEKKPIKKTVYEVKEVPYCLKKPSKCGHCGHCEECEACVRYKKVLIKKEIVCGETCSLKCVPEEYVERVAVKVCRPACQAAAPCVTPAAAGPVVIPAPVVVDGESGVPAPPTPVPTTK